MADAQYVIDIAAQMPNGTATIAELEALSAKLTGAGLKSDSFQGAIKRLSSELDAAKAAADAANAALKEGSAEYAILEREAIRAGKALERAQARNAVPIDVYRQAQQANAALAAYQQKLVGLESASKAASGEQARLANALDKVKRLGGAVDQRNAALNQSYEKMGQVVSFLPGPLGRVGGSMLRGAKASHELGVAVGVSTASLAVMAVGATVAVAAVVALSVAMAAGAVAAANYAVGQADAARSARLTRDAFAALAPETAAAAGAFDKIKAATGQSEAELTALAKALRSAKVSAADMPEALRAAALAEAALGKGGASEFISRISEGELAVGAFAREVDEKFGGIVAARMRGLDAQGKRFSALWSKLFDNLNVEPVLDAVAVLVGMFDKANPLAQAFGLAIEKAFGFVEQYALPAAYAVEAFALGFAIQMVKMYIAAKPALKVLSELFGLGDSESGSRLLSIMTGLGKGAAVLAVIVGGALAGAVGVVTGLFAAAAAVVAGFTFIMYSAVRDVLLIGSAIYALGEILVTETVRFAKLGWDLLMGLVKGITDAVPAVVGAVSGAVGKAVDAAKELLGIASPSKVFMQIGANTAEGFAEGVDDGAAEARGSMAALVSADPAAITSPSAAASVAGAAGSTTSTSSSRSSIDLSGATFNFSGVADAETARDKFAELLTSLLEGDADSLTGAPA